MSGSAGAIEREGLRVEFGEPGVHPSLRVLLGSGEDWKPVLLLGARQAGSAHEGALFPRVFESGLEAEQQGVSSIDTGANGAAEARLTGSRGGLLVETTVSLEGGGLLKVSHTLTPEREAALNRAFDRFDFIAAGTPASNGPLDYSFVPHLRPLEGMVIGDQVFRSPAVMAARGDFFFALIPDLEALEEGFAGLEARYYMDFTAAGGENRSPAATIGVGRSRPAGHVYFRKDYGKALPVKPGSPVPLGYYIMVGGRELGPGDVTSFIWERFGRWRLSTGLPQMVRNDRYASAGLSRMFKSSDLFRSFELDGRPCGGTVGIHLVTEKGVRLMSRKEVERYLKLQDVLIWIQRTGLELLSSRPRGAALLERATHRRGPKVPPQVFFQAWYNNLRSAYGAYWFGRKWNDHELLENALRVKNLAVHAPREDGVFPAVCFATDDGVFWSKGTMGFKQVQRYNNADCSTTAYFMALWYRDLEGDPRLLAGCRAYADFLVGIQLPSGAFPAWVSPAVPAPVAYPELRESATTACPAMFLALLYLIDGEPLYLEAAKRGAAFLAERVIPSQQWFDFETFYSCSRKRPDLFDGYTGTCPQNTMSMYWAAEAFRLLYLATEDSAFLDLGREVMTQLCLYQQVWDAPFMSINTFGGFGVMNTDAEWNDARQALFAALLMDYYRCSGHAEYMERGIAALRASFTTMYLEENRGVAPGNMRGYRRDEEGSVAENYAHFGYDFRATGYLQSDWGAGSACFAAAYAQRHYGDMYVDLERSRAFGINGCRVLDMEHSARLLRISAERHVAREMEVLLRLSEGAPEGLQVEVNGARAVITPSGDYRALL